MQVSAAAATIARVAAAVLVMASGCSLCARCTNCSGQTCHGAHGLTSRHPGVNGNGVSPPSLGPATAAAFGAGTLPTTVSVGKAATATDFALASLFLAAVVFLVRLRWFARTYDTTNCAMLWLLMGSWLHRKIGRSALAELQAERTKLSALRTWVVLMPATVVLGVGMCCCALTMERMLEAVAGSALMKVDGGGRGVVVLPIHSTQTVTKSAGG